MNKGKFYFRVGNAFVTSAIHSNGRIIEVHLREFDMAQDVVSFGYGLPEGMESHAKAKRNEICALLGGVDVDIVRVINRPIIEVVE